MRPRFLSCLLLLVLAGSTAFAAGDPNECDVAGEAPDVIVADLFQSVRWGAVGDITAFSIGTIACNPGTCRVEWDAGTNEHPVVTQNMFRLKDGRFEQLGQSWLKHGTFALSDDVCSTECVPGDGTFLGVNCSDAYTAFLNGTQSQLGPKDAFGNPIGGEAFTVFNFELRQQLGPTSFEIAGFVDVGNVSLTYQEYFDFRDMGYGIGVGIRYMLPIGPLRLDAAVNPDPGPGDDEFVVHFAVGMAF